MRANLLQINALPFYRLRHLNAVMPFIEFGILSTVKTAHLRSTLDLKITKFLQRLALASANAP